MSKQFDAKNAKARAKADGQPYYKMVIAYEKACPHCDEILDFQSKCRCGHWNLSWSEPNKHYYTPNVEDQEDSV